jgi:ABC-type thiamine transport system substrate-binding protein
MGLALTACGSPAPAPDTTGAASLTVLCTVDEAWCTRQVAAFEAETGIPTTFERKSAGDALSTIRDAAGKPEFSVWWGGASDNYEAAKGDGLLEPYESPNAAGVDTRYKDAGGMWTGIYAGVLAFCSNSDTLQKVGVPAPDSWDDLLSPKLQGLVSIAHPSTSGTAYTALWTLRTLLGSDDVSFAYFDQLKANVGAFTKSGSAPVGSVSEGNAAVGVAFAHDCLSAISTGAQELRARGTRSEPPRCSRALRTLMPHVAGSTGSSPPRLRRSGCRRGHSRSRSTRTPRFPRCRCSCRTSRSWTTTRRRPVHSAPLSPPDSRSRSRRRPWSRASAPNTGGTER